MAIVTVSDELIKRYHELFGRLRAMRRRVGMLMLDNNERAAEAKLAAMLEDCKALMVDGLAIREKIHAEIQRQILPPEENDDAKDQVQPEHAAGARAPTHLEVVPQKPEGCDP